MMMMMTIMIMIVIMVMMMMTMMMMQKIVDAVWPHMLKWGESHKVTSLH